MRDLGVSAHDLERHVRHPYSLPLFSFFVASALVLLSVLAPQERADAAVITQAPAPLPSQLLVVGDVETAAVARDTYGAKEKPKVVHVAAPVAGAPDPGTAKAIAFDMIQAYGWDTGQYDCLVSLWQRESGWNHYAHNPSSGAYGIPQALPGSKMATHGADWQTNPATQISWGLSYIQGRYATPCGAWNHFLTRGWY